MNYTILYSNILYSIVSYYVNTHINLLFHTIEVVDLIEVAASEFGDGLSGSMGWRAMDLIETDGLRMIFHGELLVIAIWYKWGNNDGLW